MGYRYPNVMSMSMIVCLLAFLVKYFWTGGQLFLLVAVLSSRENFDARKSIRDTWIQSLEYKKEKHFFLVGRYYCPFHPQDRISEYSCDEWNPQLPSDFSLNTIVHSSSIEDNFKRPFTPSLKFYACHSIIIRKLCLSSALLYQQQRINVVDLASRQKIASATFPKDTKSREINFICKSVEPFVYPKFFEGELVLETPQESAMMCNISVTDKSNIVRYGPEKRNKTESCFPGSLVYTVYDAEALFQHVQRREERDKKWVAQQKTSEDQLRREYELYKDIVFLETIDVYRNLPIKLLQFIKWSRDHANTKFFLKTDDDTFVDLKHVRNELHQIGEVRTWWWSSFHEDWPVQHSGKWRDDDYPATTYPHFPCGAGYVLSADLVQYIASNADYLYPFQGEDVSMGIWLAPVHPIQKNDCWECSECNPGACNSPQLSANNMYKSWDAYVDTANFCL